MISFRSRFDPINNSRDVLILNILQDGNKAFAAPLQFSPVDVGTFTAPTISGGAIDGEQFLQAALDHAWEIGLRPKGFAGYHQSGRSDQGPSGRHAGAGLRSKARQERTMTFQIGQKVVCVDDTPNPKRGASIIKNGAVYTVKGFCRQEHSDGKDGLFLCEVATRETRTLCECFKFERFRPAVEPKTDISIFTKMQTPKVRSLEDVGT